MTHAEYEDRLDDFVDGHLDELERRAMEEHASGCAACAAALAATHALLDQARRLTSEVEPVPDAWPRLAQLLPAHEAGAATHGVMFLGRDDAASRVARQRLPAVLSWLIAASLAIGAGVFWTRSRDTVHVAGAGDTTDREAAFTGLMSGLELECLGAGQALQASFRLPAATRSAAALAAWTPVLSDAVSILDRSIAETRSALARTPDDARLQALLATRYQQKLAILNAALVRVEKV